MVDSCQIPYEDYHEMSTEELAQSVIAYPLDADMFAYDSFELGYYIVKEHFGALEEFANRDDSASVLIDLFIKQEPVNLSELDDDTLKAFNSDEGIATTETGKKVCRQIFNSLTIGFLLAQNDYIEKMTLSDIAKLKNAYERRSYYVGYYEGLYCEGKIRVGSTNISTPKNGAMTGYTMKALENWLYTDGSYRVRKLSNISSQGKTALNTEFYNIYGINPISGPSVKYNCHSYAWYKQSNCNYWVDVPNTNGYTLVNKLTVNVGGKMLYYASTNGSCTILTHSAVISNIEYYPRSQVVFTVKSKWGMCGLYEHLWTDCPYYYHDINGNHCPAPNDIELYNG